MNIRRFMNEDHVIQIIQTKAKLIIISIKHIRLIHICELFEKPYAKIGREYPITYEKIIKKLIASRRSYL